MDLRSPTAPWCNHSAIHAALHVGMVSPSDGWTITKTSSEVGSGREHQAHTGLSLPSRAVMRSLIIATVQKGRSSRGPSSPESGLDGGVWRGGKPLRPN